MAGVLYTKGLTQEQVSDIFDQIYGQHYSKTSIRRMVDSVHALDAISDKQADTLYSPFLKLPEDFFPSGSALYRHIEYTQDFTGSFFGNCQCYATLLDETKNK